MKPKQNTALFRISLLTLITVVLWTGFEVYRSFTKAAQPEVTAQELEALNPELDMTIFTILGERRHFTSDQLQSVTPALSPTPTPLP